MSLSPQKRQAVDAAVRKAIGKDHAVVKCIGRRYSSKKWGNYIQFLLDDGRTAFVNLDASPLTVNVSVKPNAMHFGRYKRAQARAEKLLAKRKVLSDADVDRMSETEAKKLFNETKAKLKSVVKKAKAARKKPVVKFDPKLSTLDASGKTVKEAR